MPPPSGERHYAAKLTKAKVLAIRMLHGAPCDCCGQRLTIRALERMNGVSKATVGHIVTGRNWDIPGFAIAAGSRRAKTPKAVECEASQSGGAKTPHRPEQSA